MLDHHSRPADLTRYAGVVWRYLWLVILLSAAGGVGAWLLNARQPEVYESTTTVLVNVGANRITPTSGDLSTSRQLAGTYRKLITTRPVLEEAASKLEGISAEGLRGRVSVNVIEGTQLLTITARDADPERAAEYANTVAETFIDRTINAGLANIARTERAALAQGVGSVSALVSSQLDTLETLSVVEPAVPPSGPIKSSTRLTVVLGTLVGFALASGIAFLLEYLWDIIRSKERFEELFSTSVLAVAPRADVSPDMVATSRVDRSFEEAMRFLRTNLQFIPAERTLSTVLFTSAEAGAGKTTLATHLARTIAESGKSVLIIDADLRRPSISGTLLGAPAADGVSTFLADRSVMLTDIVYDPGIEGLAVVPSGPAPPNPAELLNTPRLGTLLKQASDLADIVLVDAPPVLAVADAPIIASQTDGVVFVVDTSRSRSRAVRSAFQSLQQVRANVVGAVLNKYQTSRFGRYYGYYYGYYGYYYGTGYDDRAGGLTPSQNGAVRDGVFGRLRRIGDRVLPGRRRS